MFYLRANEDLEVDRMSLLTECTCIKSLESQYDKDDAELLQGEGPLVLTT